VPGVLERFKTQHAHSGIMSLKNVGAQLLDIEGRIPGVALRIAGRLQF